MNLTSKEVKGSDSSYFNYQEEEKDRCPSNLEMRDYTTEKEKTQHLYANLAGTAALSSPVLS